jgi:hypothetical protein
MSGEHRGGIQLAASSCLDGPECKPTQRLTKREKAGWRAGPALVTASACPCELAVGVVDVSCGSGGGSSGTMRRGTKKGSSATSAPRLGASRHCHNRPRLTSCRRATSTNFAPGSSSSARIRSFSSDCQRRLRSTPVMISIPPPSLTALQKNACRNQGRFSPAAVGGHHRKDTAGRRSALRSAPACRACGIPRLPASRRQSWRAGGYGGSASCREGWQTIRTK